LKELVSLLQKVKGIHAESTLTHAVFAAHFWCDEFMQQSTMQLQFATLWNAGRHFLQHSAVCSCGEVQQHIDDRRSCNAAACCPDYCSD